MARQQFSDLGFAGRAAEARARLLNRDGSFNIRRQGVSFFESFSFYHTLLDMPWWRFSLVILAGFVVLNALFAAIYLLIGTAGLTGIDGATPLQRYLEVFFFSTQTFTTVGYGHVAPVSLAVNAIAALESLTGLMALAIATGLIYGRFSRPVARLIYSRHAIVAPYLEMSGFMFRIANARKNQLIDVEAKLVMVRKEEVAPNKFARKFYELDLEREKLHFFHLSWTIVHPIDGSSPLYGWTKEQLDRSEAEFLILIRAFDDTFSQTVQSRSSYKHHEVLFDKRFTPIIHTAEDGVTEIHLDKLHDFQPV
jgi:inward rectifier potassium channel